MFVYRNHRFERKTSFATDFNETYYITYLDFPMMIKTKQQIVSMRNKLKNQKRENVVELIDFRPL